MKALKASHMSEGDVFVVFYIVLYYIVLQYSAWYIQWIWTFAATVAVGSRVFPVGVFLAV